MVMHPKLKTRKKLNPFVDNENFDVCDGIVTVSDELNCDNAAGFLAVSRRQLEIDREALTFDFVAVNFIYSRALAGFITIIREAASRGTKITLILPRRLEWIFRDKDLPANVMVIY